ncbi:hypothetical protein [Deinococcus misasensis]|uniref:hypothetical protein n=1 Tax=Deinococcus misasensis TaxID=392413 RepID=UPI000555E3BA|nr:hypothetical protein [Deinococcus misasensis]
MNRAQTLEHLALAEKNGQIYAEQGDLKAIQKLQHAVLDYWRPYAHKEQEHQPENAQIREKCIHVLCSLMRLGARVMGQQALQERGA